MSPWGITYSVLLFWMAGWLQLRSGTEKNDKGVYRSFYNEAARLLPFTTPDVVQVGCCSTLLKVDPWPWCQRQFFHRPPLDTTDHSSGTVI